MFDDKSDFGEMLGEISSGERYQVIPSEVGQERNIFEEIEDSDVNYQDFQKLCSLHGS
jgi:hypothetical protein